MTLRIRLAAIGFLLFVVSSGARAQGVEFGTLEQALEANDLKLDLAVPESPAFTALGLNPEDVTRPAQPRDFAAALLNALDKEGNFQVGFALDTNPYMLLWGSRLSLHDFRELSAFHRLFTRMQLSMATSKGTDGDDESVRVGLGWRMTPWTRGDPRLEDPAVEGTLLHCLLHEVDGQIPEEDPNETAWEYLQRVEHQEAKAAKSVEGCHAKSKDRLDHASAWDVGLAPTWIQEDGGSGDVSWNGATFWTSIAYGFEDLLTEAQRARSRWPQLIAHARFRLDERVASDRASDGFLEQESLLLGFRVRSGHPDLTFSIEGSYLWEDPDGFSSDSSFRGALSSDVKLHEQFWLQLSLGGSAGREEDRIFVGATVKWGGRTVDLSKVAGALRHL